MPPRKEKAEKGDDGAKMILDYLRQQNRPYSATDISSNLHNKVTKAFAAKALKEMHDRKEIEGRVSGKQIVYHVIQEPQEEASAEELSQLHKDIERLRETLSASKVQEKELRAEMAALGARVTTADLSAAVSELENEKQMLLARLEPMRRSSANARIVTAEEQARVDTEFAAWRKHVMKRKRICRDMWDRCTEVLPEGISNRQEMWEYLGLEGSL